MDHTQKSLSQVITGYLVCFVSVYAISCCLQSRVLVILIAYIRVQ